MNNDPLPVTGDERFIRSMVESPDDDSIRLQYCDWLAKAHDSRCTYLRAETHQVRKGDWDRMELAKLAENLDPVWVARVSRPPIGVCCNRVRFMDCGPPLASEDVERVEQRLQVRFPVEFHAFLLNYNGGRPEPPCLPDPNRGPCGPLCLQVNGCFFTAYLPAELNFGWSKEEPFYGIEYERNEMIELHEMGSHGEFLAGGMIPFANTAHDLGYLLLGVAESNLGRIFHFRNYCHNTNDSKYLTEYAPSFPEFLGRFTPDLED